MGPSTSSQGRYAIWEEHDVIDQPVREGEAVLDAEAMQRK
jgi:hypothetical protein